MERGLDSREVRVLDSALDDQGIVRLELHTASVGSGQALSGAQGSSAGQ